MGKKSGPLAFLNKKGWHPGNMRNMEKVWKKEQEALAEQKQVEELRKQYEEARQKEEVEAMAVAAGVKKKQERLDWMYQGGMVAKQEADKRADAQLLGEKEVEMQLAEEPSKVEATAQLPSFYTTDTPASANEMWQRLHGDPMFAIKQQELMSRKKVVSNPVQMDAIRRSLVEKAKAKAARKAAKAEAKAAKKAAKKAKKDKQKKRAASSSDSDTSGSDKERSPKRLRTEAIKGASNGHRSDQEPDKRYRQHERNRRSREQDRHVEGDQHRSFARASDSQREREEHRSRGAEWHSVKGRERGRDQDAAGRRRELSPERHANVYHDAASAQPRDSKFGISHADGRTEEDRDDYRKETERRLEEAARRKEAADKEKAAQRYHRKEYKTGKLSEEEKARRLTEMSGNADVREEARWARLHAARKRDDSEEAVEAAARAKAAAANATPGSHHQDTAKFLTQASKDVYGSEAASLADRVGRRTYYNSRSRDDDRSAFRR